jgi:emfourin
MQEQGRIRVEVVRSGGFAGLSRAAAMDTADLDHERAEQLRSLVDESQIDRLTGAPPGRGGAPDRYQYDVTVTRGNHRRSIVLHEAEMPDAARRLVRWVLQGASPRSGGR